MTIREEFEKRFPVSDKVHFDNGFKSYRMKDGFSGWDAAYQNLAFAAFQAGWEARGSNA